MPPYIFFINAPWPFVMTHNYSTSYSYAANQSLFTIFCITISIIWFILSPQSRSSPNHGAHLRTVHFLFCTTFA